MRTSPLLLLVVLVVLAGFRARTLAQDFHRLVIEVLSVSPPDSAGDRMAEIRLTAVDFRGGVATNAGYAAGIRARGREDAGVVISEVSGDGMEIELTHVGRAPVNMEGWILEANTGGYDIPTASAHVIRGPAILAPGGVVVWSFRTDAVDQFPRIRHAEPFPYPSPTLLEVRDASGGLVDQVAIGSWDARREMLWGGPPTSLSGLGGGSLRRAGTSNQFASRDWTGGPASMGEVNPGMVLPFPGARKPLRILPESIPLNRGVGEAMVRVSMGSDPHWQVGASTPDGLLWETGLMSLPQAAPLSLELLEGSLFAHESAPGRCAVARVVLPGGMARDVDLSVTLRLDVAGEFDVPASIIIPAGAVSAEFEIRSLDDSVADGRSRVVLTASAAGYRSAGWILIQDDNEVGMMRVTLPGPAWEGAGILQARGTVSMAAPAPHDTEIALSATGRVWTPAVVVIPRGLVSAQFPVRVLDDAFVNVIPTADQVTATIPGWPVSVGWIDIIDDEHPGFTMELPEWIEEGESIEGRLVFHHPRDRPMPIRLESSGRTIRVAGELVLPAGGTAIPFKVEAPDDPVVVPEFVLSVCAHTDRFGPVCRSLRRHDDDLPAESLMVYVPEIVLGAGAVPLQVVLKVQSGWPKRTNGMAQVRIRSSVGEVRVAPEHSEIPVVNGEFNGLIRLEGHGARIVLEVEFAGFVAQTGPFEVVPGHGPISGVADIAVWPGRSNLLAVLVATHDTGPMGRLAELDPASGLVVRTLDLPTAAHRIAVSDSGTVAWLASESDGVQRIHLGDWLHAGTVALADEADVRHAVQLAISPGTTDDVLVLTRPASIPANENHQLIAIRDGVRMETSLALGTEPFLPSLVPGRIGGEFYATLSRRVYRIRMGGEGLESLVERDMRDRWPGYVSQPELVGANLVYAGGFVLDAETLNDAGEYLQRQFNSLWTAALAYPDEGWVVFAAENGRLQSNDLEGRTPAGEVGLPFSWDSPVIDRMVRWGRRGAALVSWSGRHLYLVDSAPRPIAVADLAISVAVPDRVPWPEGANRPGWADVTLVITNRGPEPAYNGTYSIVGHESGSFDALAPGESIVLNRSLNPGAVGDFSFTATVGAGTRDPDGTNNSVRASTWIEPLQATEQAIARLRGRQLVARPDGTELWVVTGPDSAPEGVAVLDPVTGERVRTIEVGPDPRRMVPTTDNSGFIVQLGASRVVRWNLAAQAIDYDHTFAGGTVVDLAAYSEPAERFAVLLRNQIVIVEGTRHVQAVPLAASSVRALAVGGGQLWVAREGELLIYNRVPDGLVLAGSSIVSSAASGIRFNTDGRWAAFDGFIMDPAANRWATTAPGGSPLLPAGGNEFFGVAGHHLRRLTTPYLEVASETIVPGLIGAGSSLDFVRWGADGFAFRTETGLIVSTRSSLVRRGESDLGLTLEAVGPTFLGQPATFRAVVTNRGPDSVQRMDLTLIRTAPDLIGAPPPAMVDGNLLRIPMEGVPAGGSRQVLFTVVPGKLAPSPGNVVLFGAVHGSANDPVPGDNQVQATFPVVALPANLGIRLEATGVPEPGQPFEVFCVVTNAGPESVPDPTFVLRGSQLQWVDLNPGMSDGYGGEDRLIHSFTPSLAAGTEVRIRLRFRTALPGLHVLRAFLNTAIDDPDRRDNQARLTLRIGSPSVSVAHPGFSLGFSSGLWSPARNQWIVGDSFGLTFLDVDTLEAQGGFDFPNPVPGYLLNPEGTHVWIPGQYPGFDRIPLSTGEVDLRIPPSQIPSHHNGTLATIPGRPEALISYGLLPTSVPEVSLIVNGVRLPETYTDDLAWQGSSLAAVSGPDGRIYVSNGRQLRELELTPQGVRLLRNLDDHQRHNGAGMTVSAGLLIQDFEEALDLQTLAFVPTGYLMRPIFDALSFRERALPDGTVRFEAFDLVRRLPVWSGPRLNSQNPTLGAGGRGVLVVGRAGGRRVPPADTSIDLRMTLNENPSIPGAGYTFPLSVTLRQFGEWIAGNVRITAELSPGVELVDPPVPGSEPGFTLPIIDPSTPITLRLRAAAPGPIRVRLRADADAVDPTPGDSRLDLNLEVPAAPVVVLSDLIVRDNGVPFILRLSHPAPEDLSVMLVSEPISIQADDLVSPTIEVRFEQGRSEAEVYWVVGDTRLEADELFHMSVAPGGLASTADRVLVTIRNDDRIGLRALSDSRFEGNSNALPAVVQVFIDQPIETQVELGFATVSGTAIAGEDFVPLSGRLLFTPNSRTNILRIPILGDSLYEADETFSVQWSDADRVVAMPAVATVTLRNDDPPPGVILTYIPGTNGPAFVRFQSVSGVRYTLQSREFLQSGAWLNEGGPMVGNGGVIELRPQVRQRNNWFYRVLAN